jgi:uncharacterized coiled-coil DUF342 family protein
MDRICVKPRWSQRSFCAPIPASGVIYVAAPNASGKSVISNLLLSAILYNYYYIDMVIRHSEGRVADSDEFIIENASNIRDYIVYPLFSSEAEGIRGSILSHKYGEPKPIVLKLAPLFMVTLGSISSLENEWKPLNYNTIAMMFEHGIMTSLHRLLQNTIDYLHENLLKRYVPDKEGRWYVVSNDTIKHAIDMLSEIKGSLEIGENIKGYDCVELEKEISKQGRVDINELIGKREELHRELRAIEDRIKKILAILSESNSSSKELAKKYESINVRLDAARSRLREIEDNIKNNVSEFKNISMDKDLDSYLYSIVDDDKILNDGIDVSRMINSVKKSELESELQQIDSDIKKLNNIYNNINNLTAIGRNIVESLSGIRDDISSLINKIDGVKGKVKDDIFNANLVETICSKYSSIEKCNANELMVYAHSGMVISSDFAKSLDELKSNISKLLEVLKTYIDAFNKGATKASNILNEIIVMLGSIVSDLESRKKHLNMVSEKINKVVDIASKINELISERNDVIDQISSLEREKKAIERQLQIITHNSNKEYEEELKNLMAEKSRLLNEIEEINKKIEKAKKEKESERKIEMLRKRCELIDKINKILNKIENIMIDIMKRLNLVIEIGGVRKYKVYAMSDSSKVMFATMRSFAFLKLVDEILKDYIKLRFGTNMKIPLIVDAIVLSQLDSNNKKEFLKMILELSSEMDQPVLIFDIADQYISREIKSDSDIDEIISHLASSSPVQG